MSGFDLLFVYINIILLQYLAITCCSYFCFVDANTKIATNIEIHVKLLKVKKRFLG